tara:strand:- start:1042 stop:1269 length:228 start_codon:yes stop_codon:yes gene_type:complete
MALPPLTLPELITEAFPFMYWIELIKSEAERAGIDIGTNQHFLECAAFTAEICRKAGDSLEDAAAEGIATHSHMI